MQFMTSRYRVLIASVFAFAMFAAVARPSSAFLDKTRFAAHLGVAYFCFHHWVLAPYQAGKFANGADHRTASLIKGGAALLFAVHEVKVSQKIAHDSNSPLLHKLDGGLVGLAASFAAVGASMKSGVFKPKQVDDLNSTTTEVSSEASAAGDPIRDVPVALPGG